MKNRIPFAALTFAFTVAGAVIGYGVKDAGALMGMVIIVAGIGAFAAAASGSDL